MSEPTSSKPYVSLRDRLRNAGKLMEEIGGHLPAPNEITHLLAGLVAYAEHGDAVLDASTSADLERILTPDRAEGYVAPNAAPADARDVEIERLRRQLSESQAQHTPQAQQTRTGFTVQPPQDAPFVPGVAVSSKMPTTDEDRLLAENEQLKRELAASRGTSPTAESEEVAQDAVSTTPATTDPNVNLTGSRGEPS